MGPHGDSKRTRLKITITFLLLCLRTLRINNKSEGDKFYLQAVVL